MLHSILAERSAVSREMALYLGGFAAMALASGFVRRRLTICGTPS